MFKKPDNFGKPNYIKEKVQAPAYPSAEKPKEGQQPQEPVSQAVTLELVFQAIQELFQHLQTHHSMVTSEIQDLRLKLQLYQLKGEEQNPSKKSKKK